MHTKFDRARLCKEVAEAVAEEAKADRTVEAFTKGKLCGLIRALGMVGKPAVDALDALAALAERVEKLEAATAEVQTRGLKFCGVFQRALTYRTGDVTTFKGSLWCAIRPTEQMPGESGDWQLIVRGARNES